MRPRAENLRGGRLDLSVPSSGKEEEKGKKGEESGKEVCGKKKGVQ